MNKFTVYFLPAILLILNVNIVLSKPFQLLILHNNDAHGRFDETSVNTERCEKAERESRRCIAGFARMAHVIRTARRAAQEGKGFPVLYLNAGDTFTGTPWFSIHTWKISADFLNFLRPDAMSFGNHEFDDGIPGLVPFINATTFPIIAANLDFANEPTVNTTKVTKSVVLTVEGRRIGVIGYLTPATAAISGKTKVIWSDEVESISRESEKLRGQGVQIIIALGHSGFEMDKMIAREVPLVDVVIGGHTNTFLWSGQQPSTEEIEGQYPYVVTQSSGKRVPVVQAFAYTKYLGRLFLTFDDIGRLIQFMGQPLLMDNYIPQEREALDILDKYRAEIDALDEPVGTSNVVLEGKCLSCRVKECTLGNLLADAFVTSYVSKHSDSEAPIGLVNSGLMRRNIVPDPEDGSITKGQIILAFPYADDVLAMSLTGADLLKTLEIGAGFNGSTSGGELLQVSGLQYTIDRSKPIGSRVEANARCAQCPGAVYEPVDPQRNYKILTTGFLNKGGDGHYVIQNNGFDKQKESLSVADTIVWYMQQFPVLETKIEGRITVQGTFPGICL